MNLVLLQAAAGAEGFFSPTNLLLLSGMMFVLYFFMLRPSQKKAKEGKAILESLQKGDKIVTAGGLHGKVFKTTDGAKTLDIEISRNTVITIEKSSISTELTAALSDGKDATAE